MATTSRLSARARSAPKGVAPKISDEAVAAKSGKTWSAWFAVLDRAGGRKMTHREIVAVLAKTHRVGAWWQQMIAVSYEQAKGLRAKHEKPEGFQISRSKTMHAPVGDVRSLLGRLELAARSVDGELKVLESQPDRSRVAAQLAGPRARAEVIISSAAQLVDGLLNAAGHDADELSLLQAACAIEADALRAAAASRLPEQGDVTAR